MADFIYIAPELAQEVAPKVLEDPTLSLFRGAWGCLAFSKAQHFGWESFEDESDAICIAGAPSPAVTPEPHRRSSWTQRFLDEWRQSENLDWLLAYSAPFAALRVSKVTNEIFTLTDSMGFVPVYETRESETLLIGSHLGTLHRFLQSRDLDLVSVVEFSIAEKPTFPYTVLQDVLQLPPASELRFEAAGTLRETRSYWRPPASHPYSRIEEAAEDFRDTFRNVLAEACRGREDISVLLSGGEDSRAVLNQVAGRGDVQAVTLADGMGREARIARNLARIVGCDWILGQRSPDHYLRDARDRWRHAGPQDSGYQLHAFGFEDSLGLSDREAVIGGMWADSFYKACFTPRLEHRWRGWNYKSSRRTVVSEEDEVVSLENYWNRFAPLVAEDIREAVIARRRARIAEVRQLWPDDFVAMRRLWPASSTSGIAFFQSNRRLFPLHEPFADRRLIEIGCKVPVEWKLNRRFFHLAIAPTLGRLGLLPHSDAWIPALSAAGNVPASLAVAVTRRIVGRFKPSTNDEPWPSYDDLVRGEVFHRLTLEAESGFAELEAAFSLGYPDLLASSRLTALQKLDLTQSVDFARSRREGR